MELPPNEVIICPTDNLNTPAYTEWEDGFYGYSFSQTESSLSESPVIKPTQQSVGNTSSSFKWNLLPVVNLNLCLSAYARVNSIELIQILLSSRYLDKQQKFVLENTIKSSSKLKVGPSLNNILFRHLFAVVLILAVSILNFYLFLITVSLIVFYLLSQIHKLFLIFSIKPVFTRVLAEFNKFENILDQLSAACKLLTRIKIVQKATFNTRTISPQNNTNLINLKKYLTNLYSILFFELQHKTLLFPLTNIPINQDELICTLKAENIFYRVYDEVLESIQGLCVSKISLDSLKLWHCLLTCQYGEYIEILAQLIDRNLQFDNSESCVSQQMEMLRNVRLIEATFYSDTLNSLTQSISFAKLDLFSLNLKDRGNLSKDFSPRGNTRQDTLDKIDLILQSCILKVRNLKESDSNFNSENELMSLKFSVENTLEGIDTVRKLSSTNAIQTNLTNSESGVSIPNINTGNELIIPNRNPLEIPQSGEIVFEGFSLENSELRSDIFREKEEYIETGATQTVLKELKCVLASKQILKDESDNSTPSRDKHVTTDNFIPKTKSFPTNSAQNFLNIAILSSNKNIKLTQTVIGDTSDSD